VLKLSSAVDGEIQRLRGPQGRWLAALQSRRNLPDVGSAGDFLIAQFKDALGDRRALTRADLEQDPALRGLLEFFSYADRDGHGKLTLAELEDYLKLIELGMKSSVWLTVRDRDLNPFHFLDSDGDGRLSYRELLAGSQLLSRDDGEASLPMQFQFSAGGPAIKVLGGVPIPAIKPGKSRIARQAKVPAWFKAMDRNGDGVISRSEFLGPRELFKKLDIDGDGVITPEEAENADREHGERKHGE
jgi:Ca2+-binding EF-hand superfamily protein